MMVNIDSHSFIPSKGDQCINVYNKCDSNYICQVRNVPYYRTRMTDRNVIGTWRVLKLK